MPDRRTLNIFSEAAPPPTKEKPPAILKADAVIFLVLYDTIERHKFSCN